LKQIIPLWEKKKFLHKIGKSRKDSNNIIEYFTGFLVFLKKKMYFSEKIPLWD